MTFTLVKENAAQICIDSHAADYKGLKHVAKILAGDILTVTGKEPEIVEQIQNVPQIVAATKGTSDILAKWEEEKKIDLSVLEGKREVFMVQLIEEDGAEKLVIVGTETIATLYLHGCTGQMWYLPQKRRSYLIRAFVRYPKSRLFVTVDFS